MHLYGYSVLEAAHMDFVEDEDDVLLLFVHWCLWLKGFQCLEETVTDKVQLGEKIADKLHQGLQEELTRSSSEILPENLGWDESTGRFKLLYIKGGPRVDTGNGEAIFLLATVKPTDPGDQVEVHLKLLPAKDDEGCAKVGPVTLNKFKFVDHRLKLRNGLQLYNVINENLINPLFSGQA